MEREIIEREIQLNQENFEIVSQVDIDVNKVDKTATVSIVRWDGSTKEVEIYDGQDGKNGLDGKDGKDGINGRDGVDGRNGTNGKDGSNGIGLNYNWNGTSLGIKREDEQNYNYVNLKGDTGATGATGATGPAGQDGRDGTNGQDGQDGVGISSITKTGTSGLVDTYTITYTNGNTSTYTITNGADGQNGQNGQDGYTPVRGTDYWTSSDIATIESYCDSLVLGALGGSY